MAKHKPIFLVKNGIKLRHTCATRGHTSPANPTATEEPNFISAQIADPTFAVIFFRAEIYVSND